MNLWLFLAQDALKTPEWAHQNNFGGNRGWEVSDLDGGAKMSQGLLSSAIWEECQIGLGIFVASMAKWRVVSKLGVPTGRADCLCWDL